MIHPFNFEIEHEQFTIESIAEHDVLWAELFLLFYSRSTEAAVNKFSKTVGMAIEHGSFINCATFCWPIFYAIQIIELY